MNVKALAPLAVVAALGFTSLVPHAQTAPQKVGFVTVNDVIAAQPGYAAYKALQDKANAELAPIDTQIKAIQAKGTAATAAEKDQMNQLITTIQAKIKDYDAQLQKLLTPLLTAADVAIQATAKAQGFSVVMDREKVLQASLVIYADTSTDLTDAVKKSLKP
ncbi:OmpH family outer membrane protein [Deinococcus sp.]|uniref:OmpH family outer membrane protein n=1 Tax=Deinococcus sp. TaxID=47478 RepID=UPI003CC54FAE